MLNRFNDNDFKYKKVQFSTGVYIELIRLSYTNIKIINLIYDDDFARFATNTRFHNSSMPLGMDNAIIFFNKKGY